MIKKLLPLLLLGSACEDEGHKRLRSFSAFVSQMYTSESHPWSDPAAYKARCALSSDVRKTESVAHPFEGVVKAAVEITHADDGAKVLSREVTAVFHQDDKGVWSCEAGKACSELQPCERNPKPADPADEQIPDWLKKKSK
jgi:hypothetical protein